MKKNIFNNKTNQNFKIDYNWIKIKFYVNIIVDIKSHIFNYKLKIQLWRLKIKSETIIFLIIIKSNKILNYFINKIKKFYINKIIKKEYKKNIIDIK